jgi:adenylate kinase
MSYYISFLGAPGSGKGTQTEFLKKKFNINAFAAGDLIRTEVVNQTEIGLLAKNYILKGELIPDDVIIDIFKTYILKNGFIQKGFISDGYPRTIKQAESFVNLLKGGKYPTKILYLDVSLDTLKERLLQRGRMDDNEESIERRFEVYNEVVNNLKSFFNDQLVYINGEDEPNIVFDSIKEHFK